MAILRGFLGSKGWFVEVLGLPPQQGNAYHPPRRRSGSRGRIRSAGSRKAAAGGLLLLSSSDSPSRPWAASPPPWSTRASALRGAISAANARAGSVALRDAKT
jgi:hypothetical protein